MGYSFILPLKCQRQSHSLYVILANPRHLCTKSSLERGAGERKTDRPSKCILLYFQVSFTCLGYYSSALKLNNVLFWQPGKCTLRVQGWGKKGGIGKMCIIKNGQFQKLLNVGEELKVNYNPLHSQPSCKFQNYLFILNVLYMQIKNGRKVLKHYKSHTWI